MNLWQKISPTPKRLVMWGAADQGRVNRPTLEQLGAEIVTLIDDTPGLKSPFAGIPILEGWAEFERWHDEHDHGELGFVIAIGNPYGHIRCRLHDRLVAKGLRPVSFADETSLIRSSVLAGEGLQVMPGALINNDVRIGRQCIVNTQALVEHDCVLEDGTEIAPRAVLCGRVHVGANTWIGAGATVRPRIRIGRNVIVGAGSVVVKDVPDGVVVAGVPARVLPGRLPASAVEASEN